MNESLAFTGHRPDKLDDDYEMTSPLVEAIENDLYKLIIAEQPREIVCGMAIGIDMLVAKIAIELKIPLIACPPFKGQERKWSMRDRETYFAYLCLAKEIVICDFRNQIVTYLEYLEMEASAGALWEYPRRNGYMVDRCAKLVGVTDGLPGSGTEGCIKYARKVGKPVIIIDIKKYRK